MLNDVIVLKFGSSVLRSCADVPTAVHEIYRWYRSGWRVVTIVSAIGETTEALLRDARDLAAEPPPHATAELLATGERTCAALLGIALDRAGVPARVIDPREIALTATGSALDAEPTSVDGERVRALLDATPVIVVPGFFGSDAEGRLNLFGRGGSDLTAVYLATALRANRCRLIKDVDGVYESDPAAAPGEASNIRPRRYAALGYTDALERAAPLIQPKAVRLLEHHTAIAEIASLASPDESTIGPFDSTLAPSRTSEPLSVLLLGLGTVGRGVYERVKAMPERFRVVGALVRDRAKHIANGIPEALLLEREDEIDELPADVVVDALPGLERSGTLVGRLLSRGVSVISANKALIADAGTGLTTIAARNGAQLRYSAAVGGSAPMLETLRRMSNGDEIRCVAGILNGTCNYVLDRCAEGLMLSEALHVAQTLGFAEANPAEDLSGNDAIRKLRILVRHAFGQELSGLAAEPLNAATFLRARAALQVNETLRVIARAWKLGSRVLGQIQLEAVAHADAFAHTRGEWNRLVITRANGEDVVVRGRGAGRWPTTEAVMADLFDVRFARQASAKHTTPES